MTERFVYYTHKDHDYILDTPHTHLDFIEMLGDALSTEEIVDLLNKQDQRIQELEDKLENWKQLATVAQSENSILHNELGIAIEQGYDLSDAFKEYKKGVVTDD